MPPHRFALQCLSTFTASAHRHLSRHQWCHCFRRMCCSTANGYRAFTPLQPSFSGRSMPSAHGVPVGQIDMILSVARLTYVIHNRISTRVRDTQPNLNSSTISFHAWTNSDTQPNLNSRSEAFVAFCSAMRVLFRTVMLGAAKRHYYGSRRDKG